MVGRATLTQQLSHTLHASDLAGLGEPLRDGPVDAYELDRFRLLIVTDRVTRGGQTLGTVPFKGEVVTQMSTWWLDVIGDVIPNAVERVLDPQALLVRKLEPLPVRIAVYGFATRGLREAEQAGALSRATSTALERASENSTLDRPAVVPLVCDGVSDRHVPVTPSWAHAQTGMDEGSLAEAMTLSRHLFRRSQILASLRGLTLADTVYSFGRNSSGNLSLLDLVHTPFQSTYWLVTDTGKVLLDEKAILDVNRRDGGLGQEIPVNDDLRLDLAEAYQQLGERFIAEYAPSRGPVVNRLSYSLSNVGIVA